MFEFLFKYSPTILENGFYSASNLPQFGLAIGFIIAISLILVFVGYRKTQAPLSSFFKTGLLLLRYTVIIILGFNLIEPVITLTTAVPKKSSVLLMIDASKSMQIRDARNNLSRTQRVKDYLQGSDKLVESLKENFNLHTYTFSDNIAAIDSLADLKNDGARSDFSEALRFATEHLKAQPLAAVIFITDGNDTNTDHENIKKRSDPFTLASMLGKQKVPVFTVGVGSEIQNDVRLVSVDGKSSVTGNGLTNISAYVASKGNENQSATFQILEDDILLKSEKITLQNNFTRIATSVEAIGEGYHHYTAKIVPDKPELISANNDNAFLVDNSDKKGRVLYVEDLHPWEFKFIKRALDHDRYLHFTSMVKTGKDFYRQGIRSPRELEAGFPTTRGELFKYDALIVGSIHASAFSTQQINLIKDFVSIRGGGLIMLGGPKSFSQGNWQNTTIDEILPVTLVPTEIAKIKSRQSIYTTPFKIALTPEGYRSPLLEFSQDLKLNKSLWESLPELLGFHLVGSAKPGATILAKYPDRRQDDEKIIIAAQQYGRGRSMVIATSSIWRWQMQLPSDDTRHEQFWRQITRWAALKTPAPIHVALDKEFYSVDEPVKFYVTVLDSQFQAITNAQLAIQIKPPVNPADKSSAQGDPPIGRIQTIDAVPDLQRPGHYIAEYLPAVAGFHQIDVLAHTNSGQYLGHADAAFLSIEENKEFLDPGLHENFLRRIASVSRGAYMDIDEAGDLADKITVTESVYSKVIEHELWDAPVFFFLLILLMSAEWSLRRAKGLS